METEYRIMTGNDLEEVVALCNECFEEETPVEYARKVWEANAATIVGAGVSADRAEVGADGAGATDVASRAAQIYVVGVQNGMIVAHALVNVIPTVYAEMGSYAILNHVCVKPDARRGGIGTGLLDYCFALARERGCKKVELWSKNFRVAAHGLYHKYGFEVLDAKFFEKEV